MPSRVSGANLVIVLPLAGLYCAFGAGWFTMFHKSLVDSENEALSREEKAMKSISLFKEFFPGVGKHFLKVTFGFIFYIVLIILLMNIIGVIGNKFIGFPQAIIQLEASKTQISPQKFLSILDHLSDADKMKLFIRGMINFASLSIFSYLTMFWMQAVISEDKNLFKAYWESLLTVVKQPFATFIIFMSYWGSIILITVVLGMIPLNVIVQLVAIMLFTVTIVYFTMMTFLYFEKYRKNTINSWTDSFR
jgi:hypothetical protein